MNETVLLPASKAAPGGRVRLLDALRGLAVVLMVLHHAAYTVSELFYDGSPLANFCLAVCGSFAVRHVLQPLFQCLFFFISGAVCRYSRNNYRRGVIAFLCGVALEVITGVVLPAIDADLFAGCDIHFGILSCLGSCMVLWALLGDGFDRLTRRAWARVTAAAALAILWGVFFALTMRTYNVEGLAFLGFASPTFFSADWFPILPWIFVFFLGALAGLPIREGRAPGFVYRARVPVLETVGRHAILVYLLHQPVIVGVCWVVFEH